MPKISQHIFSVRSVRKVLLALLSCGGMLFLMGCAVPSASNQMCVAKSDLAQMVCKKEVPFKNNVCIGNVEGGKETNPLWVSTVNNKGFKEALEKSLTNVDFYNASESARYLLNAKLNKLEQPLFGLDMTVTCKSSYQIYDRKLKKVIFEKNIVSPYTAKFSSTFIGPERLRKANEGAVKENIKYLINDLYSDSSRKGSKSS